MNQTFLTNFSWFKYPSTVPRVTCRALRLCPNLGVTTFGASVVNQLYLTLSYFHILYSLLQSCDGANRCAGHCSQSSRSWCHCPVWHRGDSRGRDRRGSNQLGHPVHWLSQRASCQLCGNCLWLLDRQTRSMPCSWRTGRATRNGWCKLSCVCDFVHWINRRRLAIQISMPGHYSYSPDHQKRILYIVAHSRNSMR